MDENEFIITDDLPDEEPTNVASADSQVTDSQAQTDPNKMDLNELNSFLGKSYPSKEAALKSIKDTFSYVGKKKEDVAKEISPDKFITKEQYENDMFYARNQQYNNDNIREVIDAMAKSKGITIQEVVNSDSFKNIFTSVQGYNENQKLKSVLETNPRLNATKSAYTEAHKAAQAGKTDVAESLITKTVMDAFEM